MDTKTKIQDLTYTHAYLMDSNFDERMRFDIFRSLRASSHFIYANGYINEFSRPPIERRITLRNADNPIPQYDALRVKNAILAFAVGDIYEKTFYSKIDNIPFIFVISSIDDNAYFISYMPNFYDNGIMYYMLLIS